jgi:hypothetical protein
MLSGLSMIFLLAAIVASIASDHGGDARSGYLVL